MKIGIITMYFESKNCGGLLQSYALCKAIQKLGYAAEQICYKPTNLSVENRERASYIDKKKKQYWLMHIWKNPQYVFGKMKGKLLKCDVPEHSISIENFDKFVEFEKFIPHSTRVYDESVLNELDGVYDKYVCGSDQIWHLSYLPYDGYFLDFVKERNKCVAYAVSTGKISTVPIEEEIFTNKLSKFDVIGVRERTFARIIAEKYSINVKQVVDPVFLLEKREWEEIENTQEIPEERYIFVYLLGNEVWHEEYVDKYAKENNIKIVFWNLNKSGEHISQEKMIYKDRMQWGPREFIGYIHNAELVFTDSFHATAFSILYAKEFYVFKRDKGKRLDNMNFRIMDILEDYNMKWRIIDNAKQSILQSGGEYLVDSVICEKRRESLQFLKEQLSR